MNDILTADGGRLDLLLGYLAQTPVNQPLLLDVAQEAALAGLHDTVLMACDRLEELDDLPEAVALLAAEGRAMALWRLQRPQEALDACHSGLSRWPDAVRLLACAGALLFEAGRLGEAMARAREAAALDEDGQQIPEVWSLLAMADLMDGLAPQAVSWADRAISHALGDGHAHFVRATALLEMHRFDEAVLDLSEAASWPSTQRDAWVLLAWVHHRRQAWDEAEDFAHRALALDPAHGDAHAVNAAVLASRGDRAAAELALMRARRLDPGCPGVVCAQAVLDDASPEAMETAARQARLALAGGTRGAH